MTAIHSSASVSGVHLAHSDVRLGYVAGARPAAHLVQFYEEEEFLCETVCEYASAGLASGEPIVIIATPAHLDAFSDALRANSFDLERAQASRQLTLLDAD